MTTAQAFAAFPDDPEGDFLADCLFLESSYLNPAAVVAVPEHLDVLGIDMRDDALLVAWPEQPTLKAVTEMQQRLGRPVHPAVAAGNLFVQLKAKAEKIRHPVSTTTGPLLERILSQALELSASDIHMWVGAKPWARCAGALRELSFDRLTPADMQEVAEYIANQVGEPEKLKKGWAGDWDCAIAYSGWRFRVSLFRQQASLAAVLRTVPSRVPKFEDLGLPHVVSTFAHKTQGLVLFAGVTGSGKSTSLASLIDIINSSRAENILTIEDPIEYVHTPNKSIIRQREVGADTASFPVALRAALRQDPDVILVGELRDLETIATAITAAETGHLVLSTVHASDSQSAIDRLIDVFPPAQQQQIRIQLADVIEGIVTQVLLPDITTPGARRVVCEVMVATTAIRGMIRAAKTEQMASYLQSGVEQYGMQPFDLGLARAVAAGVVDPEKAVNIARDLRVYNTYLEAQRRGSEW